MGLQQMILSLILDDDKSNILLIKLAFGINFYIDKLCENYNPAFQNPVAEQNQSPDCWIPATYKSANIYFSAQD